MDLATSIVVILIIIFSAIVHEVMHGYVADRLGDPTARYAGRLTLNPLPHIDPIGSIFLPLILTLSHSPIFFGYAKPVPYNPYNLRPGRFSEAFVALAGPASNLCIALLGSIAIRTGLAGPAADVVFLIVVVNVMLFAFNLIPIPPLDGAKVLEALLPARLRYGYSTFVAQLAQNPMMGILIVVLFIYFLGSAWGNFIYTLAQSLAGV